MDLDKLVKQIHLKDKSRTFNSALAEALEVRNMIEAAKATICSAVARNESRGAHARADFENRDDTHRLKHSVRYSQGNQLLYRPVTMQGLTVPGFAPKKRTF